jgi:outer membrane protein OmpA-like peptidoglycan-associated protein
MVEHPEASIAIVGCNDDGPAERGKAGLSRSRAVAVRDYLRDAWGIADARMSVESRGLPSKPSNIRDADGVVENRRAEIYSDTWDIIAPVVTRDTLRSANPPVIRFHNDVRSSARVAGWTLTAVQRGRSLRTFTGEGNVPESVDWRIDDDQASIPRAGDSVAYRLEVSDSNGVKASASSSLPIEQVTVQRKRRERIADREIDRFSLILFDFDKSDLNETNKRIVGLVSGYIKPTSTVTIVGHTDRMGEDEYNGRLSRERAAMAARALGAAAESARGVGESAALYDNGLPEGRFYNRTVEILVETPVDSY